MKFLPSLKSVKAIALAAVTIATAISGSVAPSQAAQPNRIISAPGQAEVAVFGGQSLSIGCQAVRNLWSGTRTEQLSATQYQQILVGRDTRLAARLHCNEPNFIQGYTSSGFGVNAGVIVTNGVPFYIKSSDFFGAMGITPKKLSPQDTNIFINTHPQLKTNVVLETFIAPPTNEQMTITVINRGAYVAKYETSYRVGPNSSPTKSSGNITVGNRFTFFIPPNATDIQLKGLLFTGFFTQTQPIFTKPNLPNTHNNICFTTTGTTFKSSVNNSCN